MFNGEAYDADSDDTIAVNLKASGEPQIAMGTWLLVCNTDNVCATGKVKDTGRFPSQNLDLAPRMFEKIGQLSKGRTPIHYWRLEHYN